MHPPLGPPPPPVSDHLLSSKVGTILFVSVGSFEFSQGPNPSPAPPSDKYYTCTCGLDRSKVGFENGGSRVDTHNTHEHPTSLPTTNT